MLAQEALSSTPVPRPEQQPTGFGRRLVRQLLAVSLFYKVLLANGVLVLGATLAGMTVMGYLGQASITLRRWEIVVYALGVTALSLLVNACVLRAAFSPLQQLEATANAVRRGERTRRAPHSLVSDAAVARLIDTFNAMLESQDQQRAELAALSSRTLDVQEEERRRIARELHDETAQELTALLVRIRLAADGSREPATRERLAELRAATARSLEGVRRLARELRPTILDDLGLDEAVRAYAHEVLVRRSMRVEVHVSGLAGRLDAASELVLYRVIQEALNNVAKHADARWVEVTIEQAAGSVVATVEDNGRGFTLPAALTPMPTGQGLGLLGMRERLALVGGTLEIDARPGGGTLVRATIPLENAAAPPRRA